MNTKHLLLLRNIAYSDAQKVDSVINTLLQNHPIEKEPEYWMTYCRTVKSGLDMIESSAMEHIKMNSRF